MSDSAVSRATHVPRKIPHHDTDVIVLQWTFFDWVFVFEVDYAAKEFYVASDIGGHKVYLDARFQAEPLYAPGFQFFVHHRYVLDLVFKDVQQCAHGAFCIQTVQS